MFCYESTFCAKLLSTAAGNFFMLTDTLNNLRKTEKRVFESLVGRSELRN